MAAAKAFEQTLELHDLPRFCDDKVCGRWSAAAILVSAPCCPVLDVVLCCSLQARHCPDPADQTIWSFMRVQFNASKRHGLLAHLGYDRDSIAAAVMAYTGGANTAGSSASSNQQTANVSPSPGFSGAGAGASVLMPSASSGDASSLFGGGGGESTSAADFFSAPPPPPPQQQGEDGTGPSGGSGATPVVTKSPVVTASASADLAMASSLSLVDAVAESPLPAAQQVRAHSLRYRLTAVCLCLTGGLFIDVTACLVHVRLASLSRCCHTGSRGLDAAAACAAHR